MSKLRQAAKGVDVFQMQAVDAGGVDSPRTACTVTESNVIVIDMKAISRLRLVRKRVTS